MWKLGQASFHSVGGRFYTCVTIRGTGRRQVAALVMYGAYLGLGICPLWYVGSVLVKSDTEGSSNLRINIISKLYM